MTTRFDTLEREVKQLRRSVRPTSPVVAAPSHEQPPIRFQARGLKTRRATLGIRAENYGRLIGVSGITIYNWESGTNRPRASHLPAIAAVRRMGKREVLARLEQMSK